MTPEAGGKVSKTALTQVGRALKQLGIEHIAAYSPQARGRSERMFGTLQDRLPKELKLAGIDTVEAANRWLRESYMAEHNERFAINAAQEGSAFVADAAGQVARDPMHSGGSGGGQRQHGEMGTAEPATASEPVATVLCQGDGARARVPDGRLAVFWGPHRLADYDARGSIIQRESCIVASITFQHAS